MPTSALPGSRDQADLRSFLSGLSARAQLVDCPLGAFKVTVNWCSGEGECAAVCPVGVFGPSRRGACKVVNEELCFGCMACVAQCADSGVAVEPARRRRHPTLSSILS